VAEHGPGVGAESRGPDLLTELVRELATAPSGVAFISSCLDRVRQTWQVREARAVIDDPVLGLQLFNASGRPLDTLDRPATILALGPGIHTEPALEADDDYLGAIAGLCDVALKLDRLRYESLHDPLTGLYNRRGFDEHLMAAVARSLRYRWTFGLVIIDLDGFKSINDRIGHQGGDAVLRQVGERLRQGVRSGDIAARLGGDEFGLLLPIDGPASLDAILDRLHGTGGFGEAGDVGWTSGLAMCPQDAATVDDLYRVADRQLYRGKAVATDHSSARAK
jgi:diguanylate cyclase (GGDEF)-like protein